MEKVPHDGSTELLAFLDAERLRFPLDEAAERCSDPTIQSDLWTCASTSAYLTGELADLPYAYAKRAVRANPLNEAAWSAYRDALHSDHTDLAWDLEKWLDEARLGDVPAELPRRALEIARSVAEEDVWDEADLAALARLEVLP